MKQLFVGGIVAAVFCAAPALAADMAVKASSLTPVPVYSWTGFYAGGNVGHGWGSNTGNGYTSFTDPFLGFNIPNYFVNGGNQLPGVRPSGVIGGGQIGYDWQISPMWVLGIVTDLQASGMKASASVLALPTGGNAPSTQSNNAQEKWFGTLRGKVGYAASNWLVYGTGGLAYGNVSANTVLNCPACAGAVGLVFAGSSSSTQTGWTVGGGIEYGLMSNWTVGVEYLYVNLGTISTTATQVGGAPGFGAVTWTSNSKFSDNIARVSINYKFGR
jgi:outer membrane immunogenic protein